VSSFWGPVGNAMHPRHTRPGQGEGAKFQFDD
jgi:hypothetical protein